MTQEHFPLDVPDPRNQKVTAIVMRDNVLQICATMDEFLVRLCN